MSHWSLNAFVIFLAGRLSTTLMIAQESLKERMVIMLYCNIQKLLSNGKTNFQIKYKEERTSRFQELQLTHRQVCDMVALYLGMEPNDVLEGVADDAEHLALLNDLIYGDRRKSVMFYYQDGPQYPIGK